MKLCKFFRNYNIFNFLNSGFNNVFVCMENKMVVCFFDDCFFYDIVILLVMFFCIKGK